MASTPMSLTEARRLDRKRWLWPLGFAVLLVIAAAMTMGWWQGIVVLTFAGPIFTYVLVPVVDWLVGADHSNLPEGALDALEHDPRYRYATYVFVVFEFLFFVGAAAIVGLGHPGALEWLGITSTVGMMTGVSINTAHELGHKTNRFERTLAKIALAPVGYGHFLIEHNYGHHSRVATSHDPASARLGESFWAFLPRTVIGSLRSAWRIETARLARRGRAWMSLHNELLQAWGLSAALWLALMATLGWSLIGFLIVQALLGLSLLEAVNYSEHYGLARARTATGGTERCRPAHSWNNDHIVTNILLFHLQRHSDHHAHPTRRYQSLRHFDEAPQLPTGYAGMIVLAYVPWLWFRVMDPRVAAHYDGDIRRANLAPGQRERLIALYPPPAV